MTSKLLRSVYKTFALTLLVLLSACADKNEHGTDSQADEPFALTVYKTPTCGCCGEWVDHINTFNIKTDVIDLESVAGIKDQFEIPAYSRSCHTAVYEDHFVFEGHVPAKFINRFLSAPPKGAIGLAVPAMPVGSPGMEYEDKFNPYQILLLNEDGTTQVFAEVAAYDQQF